MSEKQERAHLMRLVSKHTTFEISDVALKRNRMRCRLSVGASEQGRRLCLVAPLLRESEFAVVLDVPAAQSCRVEIDQKIPIRSFLGTRNLQLAMMSYAGVAIDTLDMLLPSIAASASDPGDLNAAKDTDLVTGWAINAVEPDYRVSITAKDDGGVIWKTRATLPRADLDNVLDHDGFYGFAIPCGVLRNKRRWAIEASIGEESMEILSGGSGK